MEGGTCSFGDGATDLAAEQQQQLQQRQQEAGEGGGACPLDQVCVCVRVLNR